MAFGSRRYRSLRRLLCIVSVLNQDASSPFSEPPWANAWWLNTPSSSLLFTLVALIVPLVIIVAVMTASAVLADETRTRTVPPSSTCLRHFLPTGCRQRCEERRRHRGCIVSRVSAFCVHTAFISGTTAAITSTSRPRQSKPSSQNTSVVILLTTQHVHPPHALCAKFQPLWSRITPPPPRSPRVPCCTHCVISRTAHAEDAHTCARML